MAEALELRDGSYVIPHTIFDVLDTIEEYIGTDVRQYLEEYMVDGEESVTKDEYLNTLLETIDGIITDLERSDKRNAQYHIDRLHTTIRRELGDSQVQPY